MAFGKRRKMGNSGSNPGLTPIDDIHGEDAPVDLTPDSTTGRLPGQDETEGRKKDRRSRDKRNRRKM